jgi:hypothetical protein
VGAGPARGGWRKRRLRSALSPQGGEGRGRFNSFLGVAKRHHQLTAK